MDTYDEVSGRYQSTGGIRFSQFLGKWVEHRNIRNYRQSKYIPSNYLNVGARLTYGVSAGLAEELGCDLFLIWHRYALLLLVQFAFCLPLPFQQKHPEIHPA